MLLDQLTTPLAPEPEPIEPAPKKKRGPRQDLTPLWRFLRYDEYKKLPDIAKAIGRSYTATSVLLCNLKKKGLVQNKGRGTGWRKDRKVDLLINHA